MNHKLTFLLLFYIAFSSCKTVSLSEIEERYLLKDSSNEKYYLVNLIRENQKAGILGESPLLFIDNEFITDAFKKMLDIKIRKIDIHNIEILDCEKSVKQYGARGKYGFIRVSTSGWKKPLP